jgi:hypothetical protein
VVNVIATGEVTIEDPLLEVRLEQAKFVLFNQIAGNIFSFTTIARIFSHETCGFVWTRIQRTHQTTKAYFHDYVPEARSQFT